MTLAEVAARIRERNLRARLVHDVTLAGGREEAIKAFEADPDFTLRERVEKVVPLLNSCWHHYRNTDEWPVSPEDVVRRVVLNGEDPATIEREFLESA